MSNTAIHQRCCHCRFNTTGHTLSACEQVCKCCGAARGRPPSRRSPSQGNIQRIGSKGSVPIACSSLHPGIVVIWTSLRGVTAERVVQILPAGSEGTYSSLGRRANIGLLSRQTSSKSEPLAVGQDSHFRLASTPICVRRYLIACSPSDRSSTGWSRISPKCCDMMKQRSPLSVRAATSAASNQRAP